MDKYLKMADVFKTAVVARRNDDAMTLNDGAFGGFELSEFYNMDECQYAAHAINSHDELVAEVEKLRMMIKECYPYIKDKADWGNEYEVDLANRLFDAAK